MGKATSAMLVTMQGANTAPDSRAVVTRVVVTPVVVVTGRSLLMAPLARRCAQGAFLACGGRGGGVVERRARYGWTGDTGVLRCAQDDGKNLREQRQRQKQKQRQQQWQRQQQQQIPFGDDNQRGNGNGNSKSKSNSKGKGCHGMTADKA
jgi:hypothetical protein